MWLAHFGYHPATICDTVWPVTQRFAADRGWSVLREPEWVAGCCRAVGPRLPNTQVVILERGLLLSLHAAYLIARKAANDRRGLRTFAPWAGLAVAVFAAGVWILLQPIQMRRAPLPG